MDVSDPGQDPVLALASWVQEARRTAPAPDAMTLATATPDGRPSARVVLLRDIDERGLTFFTNRESRKGRELAENPRAALVLHWWELGRQVRVEGEVEEVERAESEAYWATRPRSSRIAGAVSPQSQPIGGREELERLVVALDAQLEGEEVPLPAHWGGYRVRPDTVEFWTHRDSRLHDRIRYTRGTDGWSAERLAP